jgi:hypothetical protein
MNNNDEKGYVTPTPVDTNQTVNPGDTMLGRERENIIVATNQVNKSINEEQIKETNNKIKYKKTPLIVKFLSIVITLLIIFFVSFYVIKYASNFIKEGEVKEETTTTISALKKSQDYFNKDTVRKYETEGKILLFLPKEYNNTVYYIEYDNTGVTNTSVGNYTDDSIELTMDEEYTYEVSNNGLMINGVEYKINSGELKYYTYKDNKNLNILIINATPNALRGLYINNNNYLEGSYMEYEDKITITDSLEHVFIKNGDTLTYNGVNLSLNI